MHANGSTKPRRRWAKAATIAAAIAAVAAPTAVLALDFPDVADDFTHHDNIAWLVDNGITAGCGDGTNFCPADNVSRGQMATFMRNLAGHVASAGVHVENLNTGPTITSSYNNLNDVAPTVTLEPSGILTVDLGFDLGDRIVQCTPARRTDTNLHIDRTCAIRVDGEEVKVSNYDVGSAELVDGDFFLSVSG